MDFAVRPNSIVKTCGSPTCFSKIISKNTKGKAGGYRLGSGRGMGGWYNGIHCDSSWELAYVIYCLDHKIDIKRNTKKFKYIYENKIHYYIPDFIVENDYVEIKGYTNSQWLAKLKYFEFELTTYYKNDLLDIFNYVEFKYGKNYMKLYDGNPYDL